MQPLAQAENQLKIINDDDIQFALFGGMVSDEAYEEVKAFAEYIKDKYKKKGL